MQTITFDGSKIFSINRDKGGQVNIFICENEIGLESGKVLESRIEDDKDYDTFARLAVQA